MKPTAALVVLAAAAFATGASAQITPGMWEMNSTITSIQGSAIPPQVAKMMTGKTVTSIAITPPELTAGMVAAGLPEGFAKALVAFQVDAVIGYHGAVTDVVERFSGRKPTAFADFLAANRAALG